MTELVELLKEHARKAEGLKLKPYLCPAGKLTIGYGRNLEDNGISVEEAEALLSSDAQSAVSALNRAFDWFPKLDLARQLVLADMAFNMGMPRLRGFKKMLAAVQAGDFATAAFEMKDSRWYGQVGNRAVKLVQIMRTGEL